MIEQPKYQINIFGELETTKGFGENPEIRFAARIALMYYIYAYHEMINFCEIKNELFKKGSNATEMEVAVYTSKAWAAAYGMYSLMRTVLESTRKIRQHFTNIDWSDNIQDKSIKDIIDTANDIVKHPLFNGENSNAYLPEEGIGIDGEIELRKWTGVTQLSTNLSLFPEKDFAIIANYMRYLGDKIKQSQIKS